MWPPQQAAEVLVAAPLFGHRYAPDAGVAMVNTHMGRVGEAMRPHRVIHTGVGPRAEATPTSKWVVAPCGAEGAAEAGSAAGAAATFGGLEVSSTCSPYPSRHLHLNKL